MEEKEIFAAIEVADHEVRMVVGEFFNTRFNILKVERIPTDSITYDSVKNPEEVTRIVRQAADETAKMLGADVERVILSIPSWRMKRKSVKATVPVEGLDGLITVKDIHNAIKNAQGVSIDKDLALIQTVCVKYTIDGIASRRIPINEKANELTVDIDLLCADRQFAFTLVGCIEKAGLQVMDIFLDVFAAAKEAALFEQAVDQNVILLKMEREATTVGRLAKGKLMECGIVPIGVGTIASNLVEQYGLERAQAAELVKYSARLNEKVYSDNPVYIWSEEGNAKKITEKELCECIQPAVEEWLSDMEKLLSGILQAAPTTVKITGEGGEMQGLNELLQKRLNCEVRNYIPETLGGRNAGMTSCLGLFYAYKDKLPITGYKDNSLDMDAFMKSVSYRERKEDQEDTLTKKLKGMFGNTKK
ncbi:MAG: cell division protein FtsA [Solobacterium sp.]|nr:cell division protein FtsA [Solobacterium sp.]